ncbi:MAG: bacillithiol biosynthesis BshC, partial [Acidobacteriota bacterium]
QPPHRAGARGSAELVEALVESNRRWGLSVREDVERWARGEAVTLVAGQQVGFAGGPLYTLAKLASLLKMKRDLEAEGAPATVFFWLATEDHDYAEVATASFPVRDRQVDLVRLRATRHVDSKGIVGRAPIPEPLKHELLKFFGMSRPTWLREGVTFGESFAELIAQVVKEGVVLVDALLPELRRAGAPLFESIVARTEEVQQEIAGRSRALSTAGYTPQVLAREGEPYTLLFRLDEKGNRQPFDGSALDPETISTSALTRPLLQDAVLQPDVFVGGPAEVAYYAQIAGLYGLLGVQRPRVALRGHALVAPHRVARYIERYDIDPVDVFSSADEIIAEREPRGVGEIHAITREAQQQLETAIQRIREVALPADHALARSINRSVGHIDYHFNKLSERAVRGLARKERERYAAVREVVATLYPDRHVQDRVVSWFGWWHQFGDRLLDRLVDEIEPDALSFAIVSL